MPSDGTPEASVDNTLLIAVGNADIVLAADAYSSVLAALVSGYVLVDHAGGADDADLNICPAVTVDVNTSVRAPTYVTTAACDGTN